jgi:hypothetical protein
MARSLIFAVALLFTAALVGFGTALAEDCKDEISATSKARPTEGWAKSLAIHKWARIVRAKYGEEYNDFKFARNQNIVCFPATFGKRCSVTAVPCVPR